MGSYVHNLWLAIRLHEMVGIINGWPDCSPHFIRNLVSELKSKLLFMCIAILTR